MICASSKGHQDFIKCVKSICEDKEYSVIYAPEERQGKLSEKFTGSLPDADIILMDVSPEEFKDLESKSCYLTNQGVLIEFGYITATEEYYNMLYIFCENNKLEKAHPYVRNETIHKYTKRNLREKIIENIVDRRKKIPAELREKRKRLKNLRKKEFNRTL